ncbi:3-phosphoinositide dependent protein kinase-1 [Apophysomyces sp. BC1034]|nr:3-phosphoinositide dependent protein kinase-1 [Apophysomyces sp. BC1015]KAG0169413.1 3-phosphoinositide dependent protein kinase-1 [Apophysomyces sp. BC1021]KAG0184355.1 3-phosphoinositide dependent protein kinase-1 [Apophysomyces sp. BC1034]
MTSTTLGVEPPGYQLQREHDTANSSQSSSAETVPQNPKPITAAGSTSPTTVTNVDDPSHPLFHHRRTVGDFEYGDILGEGSYSTVLIGRDKRTGKQYAIKKLDKAHIVKNDKVKYVMIERDALSKMNHPAIVKLYWTFKDNRSLYFVLDMARNGELYTYIRRLAPFDINTARFYAAEILLALEHIHDRGVIHRDIKPENILLDDDMHIKITDFGSAKLLQGDASEPSSADRGGARSFVGTADYVSPELLRSDPTSKEADLWAFGCVVFQMLSGRSPFKASTDYLIFQKIKNLEYSFPEDFPEVAKDLVEKLLVLDPAQRLGSDRSGGIEAIKNHPFFQDIDWDTLFESQAPPLKERLEEEMRKHQVPQNKKSSDDEREDQGGLDMWFGAEEEDPFSDNAASQLSHSTENDAVIEKPPAARHYSRSYGVDGPVSYHANPDRMSRMNSTRTSSTNSSTPERIGEQSHPPWIPHLYPNESILRASRVTRRRGFFSKKRYLILTNRPRLLYMDEGRELDGAGGTLRCEIGWTAQLLPELKGKSVFCIHTPQKSYTFEDPQGHAQDWVNTINSMLVDSFGLAA